MTLEDKLRTVRFVTDREAHIKVEKELCRACAHHVCVDACPAGCYTLATEGEVIFSYDGCLECGTCYLICDRDAIKWDYPRGGYGVCYRYV